jgi:hypothetical protein
MRFSLALALILTIVVPAGFGQALPAAEASPISTGFALPLTAGSLQYAVSTSESLIWGYYGNSGAAATTNVSGDAAYISNSKRDPFSMIFAGGHSWSNTSQPSYSFFSLSLSQVISFGRWNFVVSDGLSYLPGTPTVGLSGVPGLGDLGVAPVQVGPDTGQGVLTDYSSRVSNVASASLGRQITGKTSATASGSYSITRFLGNDPYSAGGLDNSSVNAQVGVNHQLDPRTSIGADYAYSTFTFSGNTLGVPVANFRSQTVSGVFTRQMTRKLSINASAGPQWISNDQAGSSSSTGVFAAVGASYVTKFGGASLAFVRNTNGGYGVGGGALSDSVSFTLNHTFARVWSAALTSAYTKTTNLPLSGLSAYTFNTAILGVQTSRALARNLSAYGSYTLQHQSAGGSAVTVDAFNGLSQVLSFGVTYSPMSMHVGRP